MQRAKTLCAFFSYYYFLSCASLRAHQCYYCNNVHISSSVGHVYERASSNIKTLSKSHIFITGMEHFAHIFLHKTASKLYLADFSLRATLVYQVSQIKFLRFSKFEYTSYLNISTGYHILKKCHFGYILVKV